MPAQLSFLLYLILSVIVFPVVVINLIIVKTPFLPAVKSFIVTTGSMNPTVPKGSLVYTVEKRNYSKGDIVTFDDSIGKVAHRIEGLVIISGDKYYKTKGDANAVDDDELIPQANIYGKIVATIPYLGDGILYFRRFAT